MSRIIYALCFAVLVFFGACQELEEGCTDPRAVNFDAAADVLSEAGCTYYQLQLQLQHYSANGPNDTLGLGNWTFDEEQDFFYLERCNWLGSKVHLTRVGSVAPSTSPSTVFLYSTDNSVREVEDNFFLAVFGNYLTDATGWVATGNFDRVSFRLGIAPSLQKTDPEKTEIQGHPLSFTANPYLYDTLQQEFQTLDLVIVQPTKNNRRVALSISDVFDFSFPYPITVESGRNIPIGVRINYDALFDGVSFSNDPVDVLKAKIRQNIPNSFSVY